MADSYVTIDELDQVTTITDSFKLLLDDTTNGDTKSALVSVLKAYIADGITPYINETTSTWFVGDTDTGVKVGGLDFSALLESTTVTPVKDSINKVKFDIKLSEKDGNLLEVITAEGETGLYAKNPGITFCSTDEITTLINTVWEE